MERVVAGSSKVDENVALRLKNLDRVTTKIRDLPWVVSSKLLIALMTGNYRQERDTKKNCFSLYGTFVKRDGDGLTSRPCGEISWMQQARWMCY